MNTKEMPESMSHESALLLAQERLLNKDPTPKNVQSFVMGILSGGQNVWLKEYVESAVFQDVSRRIKQRSGLDINLILGMYSVYTAGTRVVPWIADKSWERLMSSVAINSRYDSCKKVLTFVTAQSTALDTPWFHLHGQHSTIDARNKYDVSLTQSPRFFWFENTFFLMHVRDTAPVTQHDDDTGARFLKPQHEVVISCFGRSDLPIRNLINHCSELSDGSAQIVLYTYDKGMQIGKYVSARPLSTIDLELATRDEMQEDSEHYFNEDAARFYAACGTPYRRGYLLTGPPGTGKTSLAKALASHNGVPLHIVKLGGLSDSGLDKVFSRISGKCVVLLEDIDSAGVVRTGSTSTGKGLQWQKTENKNGQKNGKRGARVSSGVTGPEYDDLEEEEHEIDDEGPLTLSALLNALDGVNAPEGRLLIMTTNAPRSLDPALIRRGRIDRVFQLVYCSKETATMCFKRIFGNDPLRQHELRAIDRYAKAFGNHFPQNSRVTPAELTSYFVAKRADPVQAIKDFAKHLEKIRSGRDAFEYDINDTVASEVYYEEEAVDELDLEALRETPADFLPEIRKETNVSEEKTLRKSWWRWQNTSPSSEVQSTQSAEASPETFVDVDTQLARDSQSLLISSTLWQSSPLASAQNSALPQSYSTDSTPRLDRACAFWGTFPFITSASPEERGMEDEIPTFDDEDFFDAEDL